jgi:hypothetical protein
MIYSREAGIRCVELLVALGSSVKGCIKLGEEMHQIGVRLDTVGLCRLDQGVQACTGVGTCDGLAEEPVAVSDHKGPYCALDPVGVERDLRMFEER